MKLLVVLATVVQQQTWALEATPTADITGFRDKPLGIISGARTLGNGTIAVADRAQLSVFFFAPDGKPVAELGRNGGGPGEFTSLEMVGECTANRLTVFDPLANRLTTVASDGKLVDTKPALLNNKTQSAFVCASEGGVLAISRSIEAVDIRDMNPGPHRGTMDLTLDGTKLGNFPGTERFRWREGDGPRQFGKTLLVALTGARVFVGTADSAFVMVFDRPSRAALPGIRFKLPSKRLTSNEEDTYVALRLQRRQQQKIRTPNVERLKESIHEAFPETTPPYENLIADPTTNHLWVAESVLPTETTRRWWGFTDNGRALGTITVPRALELIEIRPNSVLGKWTDEEGAESVRRYRLVSSAG
jgi:hypothetical protein